MYCRLCPVPGGGGGVLGRRSSLHRPCHRRKGLGGRVRGRGEARRGRSRGVQPPTPGASPGSGVRVTPLARGPTRRMLLSRTAYRSGRGSPCPGPTPSAAGRRRVAAAVLRASEPGFLTDPCALSPAPAARAPSARLLVARPQDGPGPCLRGVPADVPRARRWRSWGAPSWAGEGRGGPGAGRGREVPGPSERVPTPTPPLLRFPPRPRPRPRDAHPDQAEPKRKATTIKMVSL